MSYTERSLKHFIEELAAHQPTPGGGSVAALGGALAAGAASMSAEYTLGNEKFKDVAPAVKKLNARLTEIRHDLVELIQEDIVAFEKYNNARLLPKGTRMQSSIARSIALLRCAFSGCVASLAFSLAILVLVKRKPR